MFLIDSQSHQSQIYIYIYIYATLDRKINRSVTKKPAYAGLLIEDIEFSADEEAP